MATTMKLIAKVTVGSGGASTIEFSSIPATYTDLLVVVSARSTRIGTDIDDSLYTQFNGSRTGYTERVLRADGSGTSSSVTTGQTSFVRDIITTDNATPNTFASVEMYIPNYAGSTNKSVSYTSVMENNATASYMHAVAAIWASTSAINSIKFDPLGTFDQHSSAYLYGITRSDDNSPGTFGIQATGGDEVFIANGYKVHVFKSSGTFNVTSPGWAECLVIGGGGAGGDNKAGGGGAGGYVARNILLSNNNFPVIVGAGGAGNNLGQKGANGSDSVLSSIYAIGGGGGGAYTGTDAPSINDGAIGGSGGGGAGTDSGDSIQIGIGASAISSQGFSGGSGGYINTNTSAGGGGGGAGQAGANGSGAPLAAIGGKGGDGLSSSITGTSVIRAGGGGGGVRNGTAGAGGAGGGGAGSTGNNGTAGSQNTGSGGGGSGQGSNSGSGGSGIVIIRYPVS